MDMQSALCEARRELKCEAERVRQLTSVKSHHTSCHALREIFSNDVAQELAEERRTAQEGKAELEAKIEKGQHQLEHCQQQAGVTKISHLCLTLLSVQNKRDDLS